MKVWGYYAYHSFVNAIKKMFRSTFIIVMACVLVLGGIIGVSAVLVADVFVDEKIETEEPEINESEEEDFDLTEEQEQLALLVESITASCVFLCILASIYFGRKKGSDIFLMADVNFLFQAPMKPQSVLMFRLSFQMLAIVLGSIYFYIQLPNLVLNAKLPLGICVAFIILIQFIFVLQKMVSLGSYIICSTKKKRAKYVLPVILTIVSIVVLAIAFVFLATGKDFEKTLELSLGATWARLIPFVGWMKGISYYLIQGSGWGVVAYSLLLFVGFIMLIYCIWHYKADFYEEAIIGASKREEIIRAAQEGGKVVANVNVEKKNKSKIRKNNRMAGMGASVFLGKEMLIRRRMAKFGFLTNTMLLYLAVAIVGILLNIKILHSNEFTIIGVMIMLILFFRNYGNPISEETAKNWLFLVPESPYKKVFYAMMAGSYALLMDLLPGLFLSYIFLKGNGITYFLWFVTLFTMDFMLSAVGLMLEALFPASAMDIVKNLIQFMIKFFIAVIMVVVFVVAYVVVGIWMGLVLTLIINIVLGGLCFAIYPSFLHGGIS